MIYKGEGIKNKKGGIYDEQKKKKKTAGGWKKHDKTTPFLCDAMYLLIPTAF